MYSKIIEEKKAELKLTDIQREVLIGILLGDAHLETQNQGRTYRVTFEYSAKQRLYVEHLFEIFQEWTLQIPKLKKDQTHDNLWFQTVSHSAFRFYAHQFYENNKKRVPKNIHRFLTDRAIAYWFMDDGSAKSNASKGVIFNTQGFTRNDTAVLIDTLTKSYQLDAAERRQKEGYQIYVSGNSYERLREIIDPYIIPSMRYKVPGDRKT